MPKKEKLPSNISSLDITERKQTEEALQERKEAYLDLLENANDLIQSVNPDGNFLYVNRAWRETLGYTQGETSRLSLFDIIHPDSRAHCQEVFQRVISGESVDRVEAAFVTKDGRKIMVEGSANCKFVDGKPVATRGIFRDITERKRIEEELRESEEFSSSLLSTSPNPILVINPDTSIRYVNPALEKLTGFTLAELVGRKPPYPWWAEETKEKIGGDLGRAMRKGAKQLEWLLQKKNREQFWIETTSIPVKSHGKLRYYVANWVDITERKQMEHDLNERVKELQCLYSIADIAARPEITLDELYQEVTILLPKSWQYPEITCARIIIDDKVFETENCRDIEWKQTADIKVYGAKAGRVEVGYLEERPEIDEGPFLKEERVLIDAVAKELGIITERKWAEKALRESEENLRSLIHSMDDLIFVIAMDGTFKNYYQPSRIGDLYVPPSEFLGKHFKDVLPPEVAKQLQAAMEAIKISGETQQFEYTLEMKDRKKWSDARISPIKDQSGDITAVTVVSRNITERKRMEEELQEKNEELDAQNEELQAQAEELIAQQQELMGKTEELEAASQAKSDFLASMSHELRTPLNAIIGFSELMVDGIPGKINDEQRRCLNDILSSGEHLLHLINEVLDLSKVEARRMGLKLENLNLADVIGEVVQNVRPMLDEDRHKIGVNVEEGLPQVHADKNRLRQILLNLLSNAIKFTPAGGKLGIEVRSEGDWCQVSVVDNGIGIRKKDQERIFEAFTQVDTLPDKNKEGAGLGLALIKQLIEMIGGRIWVESRYRKGSRFTFTLPLAREDEPYRH